jgi:hypothetical protein
MDALSQALNSVRMTGTIFDGSSHFCCFPPTAGNGTLAPRLPRSIYDFCTFLGRRHHDGSAYTCEFPCSRRECVHRSPFHRAEPRSQCGAAKKCGLPAKVAVPAVTKISHAALAQERPGSSTTRGA